MRDDEALERGHDGAGDDDPTVFTDEDMIRQIRDSWATQPTPIPNAITESHSDDTVFADEDMIRQIRSATKAETIAEAVGDGDDLTVYADENLIREIRQSAARPATSADPASHEQGATSDMPGDDRTVIAGEDVIRELRIGGVSPGSTPAQPSSTERLEQPEPISVEPRLDRSSWSADAAEASRSLDDLRKRFATEKKPAKGSLVPTWLIVVGIALIVILVVVILAVVFVG